jgi:type I restriction enzyme S subunit
MGSNFFVTTIGEQLTLQRGFDITKNEQIDGKIPVVSSGGISSFHNEFKVKGPGVILGRKGSLGTVYYIEDNFWPHDTTLWVKDFKGNNPRFVYYFFTMMADSLKKMDVGAANPSLNRNHIHPLPTEWPIRSVQDKIEEAITPIEEKITLNRQINQTLEQMAQTLFKSWFVDFDLVIDNALDAGNDIPDTLQERAEQRRLLRAKADFKPLPAETRALFPSEFEETELGWVPMGWKTCFLNEVTNIVYGKNLPTAKISDSGYPVYGGNGVIGFYDQYLYEHQQVLVSCRGAASGKVHLSKPFSFVTNNSLVIETNRLPTHYLFQALLIQDLTTLTSGSAQPQMTIANMNPVQILVPSEDALLAYSSFSNGVYKSVLESEHSINTLTSLRDLLLPKLISGELALDALPEIPELAEAR